MRILTSFWQVMQKVASKVEADLILRRRTAQLAATWERSAMRGKILKILPKK
jgi:hypothetical protein